MWRAYHQSIFPGFPDLIFRRFQNSRGDAVNYRFVDVIIFILIVRRRLAAERPHKSARQIRVTLKTIVSRVANAFFQLAKSACFDRPSQSFFDKIC